MKNLIWSVALLFVVGCTPKGSVEAPEIPCVKVEIPSMRIGACDSLFGAARVVVLETTSESLLEQITKVVVRQGKLFVLDAASDRICVFDTTGRFIRSIFRRGRAAGEYDGLSDFCLDPHTGAMILYADRPNKLIYLDAEGSFLREVKLAPGLFYEVACRDTLLYGVNCEAMDAEHAVSVLEVQTGAERSRVKLAQRIPCATFGVGRLALNSQHLNFTCRYNDTLYRMEGEKALPWMVFDYGASTFPSRWFREPPSERALQESMTQHNTIFTTLNVTENDSLVCFTTNLSGMGILHKADLTATYFTLLCDRTLHLMLHRMIPVESVESESSAVVGFQQTLSQLKMVAASPQSKIPAPLSTLISALPEDNNPVLFLYGMAE